MQRGRPPSRKGRGGVAASCLYLATLLGQPFPSAFQCMFRLRLRANARTPSDVMEIRRTTLEFTRFERVAKTRLQCFLPDVGESNSRDIVTIGGTVQSPREVHKCEAGIDRDERL